MIARFIHFALSQRLVTLLLTGLLIVAGLRAYKSVPVEAFPDPDDIHVQVITLWPGQAAEEVESLVTRPVEMQVNGTPGLTHLRSVSMFGLSVVTLTFEDSVDDNFARAQTIEKMQSVSLPTGASWQLAALSTSTGEVFRYIIRGDLPLEELHALQDWVIEPALRQVPNVADVNVFGGGLKQYQVQVNPAQLVQHGVTMAQVLQALGNGSLNVGGGPITVGEQTMVVRGVGQIQSVADIEAVVVAAQNGRPVFVRDVATVQTGMAPRQGYATFSLAGEPGAPTERIDDVIEGIVLQRKGSNALSVVEGVNRVVEELNQFRLPKGVSVVPIYSRTDLVKSTVHTVLHNLIEGALLVMFVIVVFTSSVRAAIVVATIIPLSLLAAFVVLDLRGVPANLLSFGAVDFGVIVDAAVVIVEAVLVKKLARAVVVDFREMVESTSAHLGRSILFAKIITITSLIPIFTFERVEGRIFRPMALTLAAAIAGATLFTLTLVPLLCSVVLRSGKAPKTNILVRTLARLYRATLRACLDRPWLTLGGAALLLAWSVRLGSQLGTEFLPKLDEGNIWLTCVQPLGVSMEQARATARQVQETVEQFPEARLIYSQLGRPEDGTDAKGLNNLEMAVYLRPREQWTTRGTDGRVVDKEGLIALMNDRLQRIPGLELTFSQIIEDNVEEALSGVKGELAIKVFGDDLGVLQQQGEAVRTVLADVPGVADLAVERLSGQPNLNIRLNREAIARFGLDAQTVMSVIDAGVGGRVVNFVSEGQRRFDLSVRYDASVRGDPEQIARLWVDTPGGQRVPISELCTIVNEDGASRISRDGNSRRIAIKCGIRGRDMGSFVAEAQRRVAETVKLPQGYRITWEGQFENQQRASARLAIIVPASLILVVGLLFMAFQRLRYALMIIVCVPLALIGGISLLYFTGTRLSISAMIGFIALSGVCVQNGLILVGQFNALRHSGLPLRDAVLQGGAARLRPVLMTALMAAIGMYPAATSTGVGSEVQRPLALVILGGMMSAALLTLLVLPVVYELVERALPAEPVTAGDLID
jgi:cobalt-zinc-cadmium resistance protein CzcA